MDWQILGKLKQTKADLRREEIIKILLKNRGLMTKKQREEFLQSKGLEEITLKEVGISERALKRAIKRIKQAIQKKEKMVIYGDYDADGICGTAILWETLRDLGAEVLPFIPDREKEGYGLNKKGVNKVLNNSLIITVDNGITSFEGVEYAKGKGVEVIITDHHLTRQQVTGDTRQEKKIYPEACAVVHTTQLSGSGVAWVFAKELLRVLGKEKTQKDFYRKNTELAMIGTIADLSELHGLNRVMVRAGLKYLRKTERLGLWELFKKASLAPKNIEVWQISFIIAPRLNATGRLEDAMDSLRLLCTQNRSQAKQLAEKLDQINRERQALTEKTLNHARNLLLKKAKATPPLIFLASREYHQGVVGLVAGKLMEEFWRPAIVVSLLDDFGKASARSIPGVNIIELIREGGDLLIDAGGHPMAAGFTVEKRNLGKLEKTLKKAMKKKLKKEFLQRQLLIDCEIKLRDITWDLYEQLDEFAPFGIGNPRPLFVTRKLRIVNARSVGNGNKHLKLRLDDPETQRVEKIRAGFEPRDFPINGIAFNFGHLSEKLNPGDLVDLCYALEKNVWNGQKSLELKIKDIKPSGE